MTASEPRLRAAALDAMDRFCAAQGFPTPSYVEERDEGLVRFVGKAPDGREFHIGYELTPADLDYQTLPAWGHRGLARQGDEWACATCRKRWGVDEEAPPCC